METKAVLFEIDSYDREELEKMSDKELYDLASAAATVGYGEAEVLSLDELSFRVNDGSISVDYMWLYFVNI